jgi:hypothetical protein
METRIQFNAKLLIWDFDILIYCAYNHIKEVSMIAMQISTKLTQSQIALDDNNKALYNYTDCSKDLGSSPHHINNDLSTCA